MKIEKLEATYKLSQTIIEGGTKNTYSIIANVHGDQVDIEPGQGCNRSSGFIFLNSYSHVAEVIGGLIRVAGKLKSK